MIIREIAGRKVPHSKVFLRRDIIFYGKRNKKITAKAVVKDVQNFVKLSEEEITKTIENNNNKLQLTEKQKERWYKKCLCLIEFKEVKEITPLDFNHQGNMEDWLLIEKIENADLWRQDCWKIIKMRQDCTFLFLTKRIDRFMKCIPNDWKDEYDNVVVCCTIENKKMLIINYQYLKICQ